MSEQKETLKDRMKNANFTGSFGEGVNSVSGAENISNFIKTGKFSDDSLAKEAGKTLRGWASKAMTWSDEDLKNSFGASDSALDAFAKINAYDFTYKPEAQEEFNGENGMDNKEHIGVMAQELAENPVTAGTVKEDASGYLKVDTGHLTTLNTALLAELTRRVQALEEKLQ